MEHIVNNQLSIVHRKGAALLVVLFIVMAITILSLGFLSRSDVELACGRNMVLRTQMDYLADSALEHARGLILNPQDVDSEYWEGEDDQQLVAGSAEYYDLDIVRDDSDRCNYTIDCTAYWMEESERIGRSSLTAELRLDPAIGYWVGCDTTISERVTINGDVYCNGNLWNEGIINGDVFAVDEISGVITNIQGGENEFISEGPVTWPDVDDFTDGIFNGGGRYYIETTGYSAESVSLYSHPTGSFGPSSGNPAGIRYKSGLGLDGNTTIEGAIVTNDLLINGTNNVITATKNFPALIVAGDLKLNTGSLEINGLAIVGGEILIRSANTSLTVNGALFVANGISELATDGSGRFNLGKLRYSPTWQPTGGQSGGAVEFDGERDYIQTADRSDKLQLPGDYTLSVYLNPNSSQNAWACIVSKCDPNGLTNHWTLQFNSSSPRRLVVYHPTGWWDTGIDLSDVVGAWHHVGIVRTGDVMEAYLDGTLRNSDTWTVGQGSGNGHLNIGCDRTALSSYVYKGLIDQIRVYDRALSLAELYPPHGGVADLIASFGMDESGANITITADPSIAAIQIWPEPGQAQRWGSAAGAFFRSIERK